MTEMNAQESHGGSCDSGEQAPHGGAQTPQSAPQGPDGAQDVRGAESGSEGRTRLSDGADAPLTLPRTAAEDLHAVLGELLGIDVADAADRGGTDEAFIAAHARYERAKRTHA